jgi:hypothetical protein
VLSNIPLLAITDAYPERMGQPYHTEPMKPPQDAVRTPPKYQNPVFTVGFSVPANLSASQFGFSLVSGNQAEAAWRCGADVKESLQSSPQFELVSLSVPEKISKKGKLEISVSVKNKGERTGTYEAILGLKESNHKKRLIMQVPAEEQVTQKKQLQYPPVTIGDSLGDKAVYQLIQANRIHAEAETTVEVN